MNNNIHFIDQRIAHLGLLIPQCRAQSAAAETRLADSIITLEIKRIEAIYAIEKRLGKLRALISVYKARCYTYEHVLAKQIINLDLQLISAKTNQFKTYHPAAFPFEIHQLTLHQPAINLPAPQLVHSNNMAGILTERP